MFLFYYRERMAPVKKWEYLISRRWRTCHTEPFGFAQDELREVSPGNFSQLAEIAGDSSLPSGVQNDMLIPMLGIPKKVDG